MTAALPIVVESASTAGAFAQTATDTVLTPTTAVLGAAAIVVLLGVSAFFSGSEIAIFSMERHRLSALLETEEVDPRAVVLQRLREDPHRLLVTILVGNNMVNIAMASIASVLLAAALSPELAIVATTLGMSALVLVFGEITPKSYGVANAERLALRVAGPLRTIERLLFPLVSFFDVVSRGLNRFTGGGSDIERPYVTREEIEALLKTGERVGAIEETEHEMVEGVFELGSTTAREVMVPRVNLIAVDVETPLDEVIEVCATNRLTRVPVYQGTLDHVVGIADIRDAERALREGDTLDDVLLPTLQVPEGREIDDLLAEMQRERVTMVIVRDEFGETEGILTVEDILEEIVGEIFEVGEERLIRPTTDGLVVKGEVTVGEVNDVLGVDLVTEGEFETVAGLINAELGRIGDVGDSVVVDDVSLDVERVDGHRIRRVRIRPVVDDATAATDGDESATEERASDPGAQSNVSPDADER
ncbi:hemolysin family protein [Salinigranum halophilum]|jgi:CBS domain containing-hemolysin-like protein|uniref:hemolysin family protein n=1 Tax=Salinigranum halophilum TaxID=2565931 RepID=UPI0010A89E35|nr:hemolysin family protein [Salinigranum halophilum]